MNRLMTWVLAGAVTLSTTAFAAEVDRREARQQERISQGVRSRELTPRETARLERKEARIQHAIARDRAANGGMLTNKQRARINRQQNRISREIARKKHNDRHM
jgi:hypothetical protein